MKETKIDENISIITLKSDADYMIEELGYKKAENNEDFIAYQNKDIAKLIEIYCNRKTISVYEVIDNETLLTGEITIPELKAINEKVKELGWYD